MDGLARRRTLTLLAISSLTVMSGATIAPSLPALKAHFADTPGVELLSRLVLTVPALAIALCAPLAGAVIDRFGRRPVLLAMLVVYALAGASGLLLDSLGAILAGRAALGVAVASLMTAATALAGDYFQGAERERFLGRQAAFMGAGGVVFLVGGGLLADLHWRGPFAIYALSLLLIPAVIATLTPPAAQPAGAGDAPPPSMPWGRMAAVYATAALGMVAFYMIPVQLPFYIQAMGVERAALSGLAIGLATVASAVASLNFGRIRRRLSPMAVFALAFALQGAGYAMIGAADSYLALLPGLAVAGLAMGLLMPNLGTVALALAPPAARGRVSGGLTAAVFLGQFLSPVLSQPWAGAFGLAAAYRDMGLLLGAVALGALVLAVRGRQAAPAA